MDVSELMLVRKFPMRRKQDYDNPNRAIATASLTLVTGRFN